MPTTRTESTHPTGTTRSTTEGPRLAADPSDLRVPVLTRGVIAGLVGAAAVALFFLVVDLARGAPFLTPHLLGSVILTDATVETVGEISMAIVAAYTAVHIAAFLAVGLGLSFLLAKAERHPPFAVLLFLLFAAFMAFVLAFGMALLPAVVWTLGPWLVAAANLLAAAAMAAYLLGHAHLRVPSGRE